MNTPAIAVRDFFISRAGEDKAVALAIAGIVREAGLTTWLQDENFGHASFMARMEQGLDGGARVIALLSAAYQGSDYCRKEYNVALAGDPLNLKERLIVLRVGDCRPAGNLSDLAYTDLVPVLAIEDAAQRQAHLRRVVRVLIGAEARRAEIDFASLYRRLPQQILHPEIAAVPGFTGREAELEALDCALWVEDGTAALTNSGAASAAVRGLGGVGKSVLAREYAWRRRGRYHGVWWVRAETRATLLDDLIDLGARLGIPGIAEIPEREQAARLALDTLAHAQSSKPWLIVYDNVEEPRQIDRLTPRAGAHVLVTSRWSDWHGHATELPVDVFTPEVAMAYLMAHARGAESDAEGVRAAAGRLAAALGCLPLALSHARALCWSMGWGFDQYRERLPELIRKAPRNAAYPEAVFATFDLAIERAVRVCPQAETLMGIAAFVAPDRIPLDIVTSEVMSEIERGEAVAALAEVSLVSLDGGEGGNASISVHRLVQEVMRGRLGSSASTEVVATTINLLAAAFPFDSDDVTTWHRCGQLIPHALELFKHADETGPSSRAASRLLNRAGLYFLVRGDYITAMVLFRRGLAIDEMTLGPEHPNVARCLNNLAELHRAQGDYAAALPLFERALAIQEKAVGPGHPDVATSLNNLALLRHGEGDYAAALPLNERALAIREKVLGPEHPDVARSLNNLAGLQREQGDYAAAVSLYERALAILQKALGSEHPAVAVSLNNLAALHHARGDYAGAVPLFRRALAIQEKALGPEHPNVALGLNNLAMLHDAQGDRAAALPLNERALAIRQKALGPEHPDVAQSLNNLAGLYDAHGNYAAALPLFQRALSISEKALGPEHPTTRTIRGNLKRAVSADLERRSGPLERETVSPAQDR